MKNALTAKRKPRKCPACGSARMANILYGLPRFSDELTREIDLGEVVLGGCCLSDNDPEWECADCHAHVYRERDALGMREDEDSR